MADTKLRCLLKCVKIHVSNICVKTNVSNWCTCQVSKQSIGIFFSSWLRLHLQIVSIFQILHWFLLIWATRRLGIFEFEVTFWEGWPQIAGPKNIQHSHFDQKKPFNWIQFNDHKKLSILFNSRAAMTRKKREDDNAGQSLSAELQRSWRIRFSDW